MIRVLDIGITKFLGFFFLEFEMDNTRGRSLLGFSYIHHERLIFIHILFREFEFDLQTIKK